MKRITAISLLVILCFTGKASTFKDPLKPSVLKKHLHRIGEMQKLLNPNGSNQGMNKTTSEFLIEFYEQVWDNTKKKFTDSTIKTVITRDKSGNPTKVEDYSDVNFSTKTTYINFVKVNAPFNLLSNFKFYYYPSSFVKQRKISGKWVNMESDSFVFDKNNNVNKYTYYIWDTISKAINFGARVIPLNNTFGNRTGFEYDTLAKKWNLLFASRTDTLYNVNKQITSLKIFRTDTLGHLTLQMYENYTLNGNGQPISALRWILDPTWYVLDSFTNISWFDYNSQALSLIDDYTQARNFPYPFGTNILSTGGSMTKSYSHYKASQSGLVFSDGEANTYTSDSLLQSMININFDKANNQLDSTRSTNFYYPDKSIIAVNQEQWNGAGAWFLNAIDSNINTYDANNYLTSVVNKTKAGGIITPNYKDTYIYKAISGIENITDIASDFTIYPNPSSLELNIKIKGTESQLGMLKIMNITGQVVYEHPTNINSESIKLDISSYPAGVYILQFNNSKVFSTKKFIKE